MNCFLFIPVIYNNYEKEMNINIFQNASLFNKLPVHLKTLKLYS